MKTLFLVRHAKSSRDDISLPDRERPLTDRGERDGTEMGKRLAQRGIKPDLMLSSPALRARLTAEIIARKLDYKLKHIVIENQLYGRGMDDLLEVIYGLDDKIESAMLVGHNPEMTELANSFSREITHLPTCAVAEFTFDSRSWSNISTSGPRSAALDYPGKSQGGASD
jgi:phosphohistidine phosphatase